jgi:hypothetical protein
MNSFPCTLVWYGSAKWENHFVILSWANLDERSAQRFGILDTVLLAGSEQVRLPAIAVACRLPFFLIDIRHFAAGGPHRPGGKFAPIGARG